MAHIRLEATGGIPLVPRPDKQQAFVAAKRRHVCSIARSVQKPNVSAFAPTNT